MRGEWRLPYVAPLEEGSVEACLASAQIDREEADTYDEGTPGRARCLASAERWEAQADHFSFGTATSEH